MGLGLGHCESHECAIAALTSDGGVFVESYVLIYAFVAQLNFEQALRLS